jgi:hypothetical protein
LKTISASINLCQNGSSFRKERELEINIIGRKNSDGVFKCDINCSFKSDDFL